MYSDFKVKSIFRTYDVFFQQYKTALPNSIREGDILLVDSNVFKFYPDIQDYISGHKYFISKQVKRLRLMIILGNYLRLLLNMAFLKLIG